MSDNKIKMLKQLIKEMVEETILAEKKHKKKGRKMTPGGGLTDAGALRRVDKSKFMSNTRNALSSHDGDIEDASQQLGVSARSLYKYVQEEKPLQDLVDKIDIEVKKVEAEKERLQKSAEELEAEEERKKREKQ